MEVLLNRKDEKRQAGELIYAKNKHLYALLEDEDERFSYLLVSLTEFKIIQYYDDLPTNDEITYDIEDEIESVHHHTQSKITFA
ncbi:hypothetical protein MKX54_05820 [Alkalihalobacillus sp. FSL R5-0424]